MVPKIPSWLEELENLERSATQLPWRLSRPDDEVYQGMVVVNVDDDLSKVNMRTDRWPSEKIVAVILVQDPALASVHDGRFEENARLISISRNHLPELLRLARRALEMDELP